MSLPVASIENVVFDVVDALRVPVLVLALIALAVVIVELGSLGAELARRRRRDPDRLERAAVHARESVAEGNLGAAALQLGDAASSTAMAEVLTAMLAALGTPGEERRIAKRLADFDLRSLRRLERTRLLVRAGPALGLMGTLIPLSPALVALAQGNVNRLSDNLRVAFSITVLGLLIGAVAFGISLIRDRIYAQDFSDLEFVAATLTEGDEPAPVATPERSTPSSGAPA